MDETPTSQALSTCPVQTWWWDLHVNRMIRCLSAWAVYPCRRWSRKAHCDPGCSRTSSRSAASQCNGRSPCLRSSAGLQSALGASRPVGTSVHFSRTPHFTGSFEVCTKTQLNVCTGKYLDDSSVFIRCNVDTLCSEQSCGGLAVQRQILIRGHLCAWTGTLENCRTHTHMRHHQGSITRLIVWGRTRVLRTCAPNGSDQDVVRAERRKPHCPWRQL